MDDKTSNINENIIPKLRTPAISLFISIVYFVLILMTLIVLFNHGLDTSKPIHGSASKENSTATIFITIFFILLVIGGIIFLLPNLKELKTLLSQISNVLGVVLYTIGLILFFRYIPSDTLNNYPYIITSISAIMTGVIFYSGLKSDYLSEFNITYEKIKLVILFFCLITTFIIYYSADPGGLITKYFGYSLLLTILMSVFSLLYLIVVLTLQAKPHNSNSNVKGGGLGGLGEGPNFTGILALSTNILFVLFTLLLAVGVYSYPDGIFSNPGVSSFVIIFTLLITLIYATIQIINVYSVDGNNNSAKLQYISNLALFKQSFLILFGVIAVGLFISWIGMNMQKLSDNPSGSTLIGILLNGMLLLLVLTLIYRIMGNKPASNNSNSSNKSVKKNAYADVIKNSIFYFPCMLSDLMDFASQEYKNTDPKSVYIILFTILFVILYFVSIYIKEKMFLQGGKIYINDPINTNSNQSISTYEELNGTDNFTYQYGISFWLYLDSFPPNTSPSYRYYTSVLNYGNKPNILYKAETNTLIVTMPKPSLKHVSNEFNIKDEKVLREQAEKIKERAANKNKNKNKNENKNKQNNGVDSSNNELEEDYDDENIIVYKLENVLLQKWNHIIINYNGGTLDIFYNNNLVKSIKGMVPYMSLDSLSVGTNNGIQAGICNLIYFKKPLTSVNAYYLYNSVKDKKIPVIS